MKAKKKEISKFRRTKDKNSVKENPCCGFKPFFYPRAYSNCSYTDNHFTHFNLKLSLNFHGDSLFEGSSAISVLNMF